MKIVINACYGGFGLSPLGLKRWAKLEDKECYFFKSDFDEKKFEPITLEKATKHISLYSAYSIKNPQDLTSSERNNKYIYSRDIKRNNKSFRNARK
jgi:hypothetical protein